MSPQNAVIYSLAPIDNVLAIYPGSITIPARTDPENTVTINTGLSASCFFQGVFTTDGKTTYNDIGGSEFIPDPFATYTSFGLSAQSGAGTITLTTSTNDTVTHSCNFFIAAIAKPNQGLVDINGPDRPAIQEQLDSQRNYQKIYIPTETPVSHTVTTSATSSKAIAHNLGYRPSVRAFVEISGQLYDAFARPILVTVGFSTATVEVRVDANNVTFFFINNTGVSFDVVLYARVYYDAS